MLLLILFYFYNLIIKLHYLLFFQLYLGNWLFVYYNSVHLWAFHFTKQDLYNLLKEFCYILEFDIYKFFLYL